MWQFFTYALVCTLPHRKRVYLPRVSGVNYFSRSYDSQPRYWPTFRARLKAMGLPPNLDPRATEVLFPDIDAIRIFIARHPEIDFVVPDRLAPGTREHQATSAGPAFVLLFATEAGTGGELVARPTSWACEV